MNVMDVSIDLDRAAATRAPGRGAPAGPLGGRRARAARRPGSALGLLLRALAVAALVTGSLTIWAPAAFAQAVGKPPAVFIDWPWAGAITTIDPQYGLYVAGTDASLPITRATHYQLFVRDVAGGVVINQVYSSVQAGCPARGPGQCSIRPVTALTQGRTYEWYVAAYNAAGWGPWSSKGGPFSVPPVVGMPPAATLVAPTTRGPWETINTDNPRYTWRAAGSGPTRATRYRLFIQKNEPSPARVIFDMWITAAQAGCDAPAATECSFGGPTGGRGGHTWWIQTRNAAGDGAWSPSMSFWR